MSRYTWKIGVVLLALAGVAVAAILVLAVQQSADQLQTAWGQESLPRSILAPRETSRPARPASTPASTPATGRTDMSEQTRDSFVTDLRSRGYAVLPAPRQVQLAQASTLVSAAWKLSATGLAEDDIALRTLRQAMQPQGGEAGGAGVIELAVRKGAVATGAEPGIDVQAYELTIQPQRVQVTGNGPAGLFYGVQTLVQLLEGDGQQKLLLPQGVIRDWPRYELRVIHWDTKHHQDKVQTLQRFLDQMAAFKLNAVSFELEDKFEYPSHPVIGAPGAFSLAQMQELTRYGLQRHIQIIPNVQAPAHMTFVLKHKEFEALKCDGSNYMACMDEPAVRKLIFDMYDDCCKATPGVQYFHVSTDEVYYAGICEKFRKPYNPVNRSLTFVDFVNAAHQHLAKQGRRIIIWAEYPLLTEHVKLLAPDIIDGIIGGQGDPKFIQEENVRGIRQFAYVSMQGEEKLFPNYFPYVERDGRRNSGRLADAYDGPLRGKAARGNPIGAFCASWDDAGLHNETFWLAWAAMAQSSWTPGAVSSEQTVADFMDVYYGRGVEDMVGVYRDLQEQSRFWEFAWDHRPSKVRKAGYGYSAAKRPVGRTDMTLLGPALPAAEDLKIAPGFSERCAATLKELPARLAQNERLIARLQANLAKVQRNRHNLEVYLSLAYFTRHWLETMGTLGHAEELLASAAKAHEAKQPGRAVGLMVQAHGQVSRRVGELQGMFRKLTNVWEKGRYPKNADVEGKSFLHVMDDVKDHFADRRKDLTYMIAPEESMELRDWCARLGKLINDYAAAQKLPVQALPEPLMDD